MNKITEDLIVHPPSGETDASVIWLHGLGASPNNFLDIISQLDLPLSHNIKFIFPHAPYRNITINQGMRMPGWYDIYSSQFIDKEDEVGILDSSEKISLLIEQEISQFNIKPARIIVGGFSQGAAISLHTGLRFNKSLGGIIALSGYQLRSASLLQEKSPASLQIPIFLAHGLFDQMIPLQLGIRAYEQLQSLSYKVEWHTYPMQHNVIPEQIKHISSFIQKVLL